jgi:hypothetical protein
MDNQRTLIKGYRDLSSVEIDLVNEIKAKGEELGALCDRLSGADLSPVQPETYQNHDQRWVSLGKTHLQQGLMCLVRAVARPTTF